MKSIKSLLFGSIPLALLAAWHFYGSYGALNVALFLIWFVHLPAALFLAGASDLQKSLAKDKAAPVFVHRLYWTIRCVTLLALVWADFWWSAVAYLVAMFFLAAGQDQVRKRRAEREEQSAKAEATA